MEDFEQSYKKWHAYWSYLKSGIRIFGCLAVVLFNAELFVLALSFLFAELVGIIEEWV